MLLPHEDNTRFGLMTRLPTPALARETIGLLDKLGFDSVWIGDHLAFTTPILDPFTQLAYAAALSDRITVGTAVYLLPLRHPAAVAKQAASLDHLSEGRFIFGVGVGGEFPGEWELAGVPVGERGARMTESIEVLRKLWTGEPVAHDGRFFPFPETRMQPASHTPGGPKVWCGGRSKAALRRAGRMADGYMSYVITPEMFGQALDTIAGAAEEAGREVKDFGTAHLLFCCVDDSYEKALDRATDLLSRRYAMDFRRAAQRYAALGTPEDVAERIAAFRHAGVRHFNLDFLGDQPMRIEALHRFAEEVRPLLGD